MAGDTSDWERIASAYVRTQGERTGRYIRDRLRAELWDMFGDVRDRSVLDVGCGDGWLTAELVAAGASVTGVDGFSTLLEEARRVCPEAALIRHDLLEGLPDLPGGFDLAVSSMVLMDLPDLDPLLLALSRVLEPHGRFLFAILHPCFFNYVWTTDPATGRPARLVGDYLDECVWRIASFGGHNHYHRPLSAYIQSLRRHGFLVSDMREPLHRRGGGETEDGPSQPLLLFCEAVLTTERP
ncbi:MAG TPA: methyltransferase domain-containing protein [Candidatus Dormibacteraeota bacterium]|nr:methyltransferase domain-containing protein [Candidatus Dormibacteraeota bacterium]